MDPYFIQQRVAPKSKAEKRGKYPTPNTQKLVGWGGSPNLQHESFSLPGVETSDSRVYQRWQQS
jgi:hypothetical protein